MEINQYTEVHLNAMARINRIDAHCIVAALHSESDYPILNLGYDAGSTTLDEFFRASYDASARPLYVRALQSSTFVTLINCARQTQQETQSISRIRALRGAAPYMIRAAFELDHLDDRTVDFITFARRHERDLRLLQKYGYDGNSDVKLPGVDSRTAMLVSLIRQYACSSEFSHQHVTQ